MDELKLIFASNLIRLRTAVGMTQAELGEQLNYSDKSISKWERGEAIPDAAVLKRIAELKAILASDKKLIALIRKELLEIKEQLDGKRRTEITCSTSTMRGSPDPSPPRATAAIPPSSLSPSWAS